MAGTGAAPVTATATVILVSLPSLLYAALAAALASALASASF